MFLLIIFYKKYYLSFIIITKSIILLELKFSNNLLDNPIHYMFDFSKQHTRISNFKRGLYGYITIQIFIEILKD